MTVCVFFYSLYFFHLFSKDEKAHPRMKQKKCILWHDYECDFGEVPCAPDIGHVALLQLSRIIHKIIVYLRWHYAH